ncbi:MAG: glycosyltransferase family 4 protein [Solirubrobacteraceae bacterium]
MPGDPQSEAAEHGLCACVLFHEGEAQGAGIAVMRVLPGLSARGWSLHGWFPRKGPLLGMLEPLLDSSTFRQGSFAFSLGGWRRDPGVLRRVANLPGYLLALRSMLSEQRPAVVHANTLLSLPEATVAHGMGLPVVLHVHELPPPSRKTTITLRWAARGADVIVAVSDAVEAQFAPHLHSTRVVRVYNGLAEEAFAERVRDAGQERMVVGTVGAASSRKGIDVFLDAAREVVRERADVDFLHLGPPPWESQELTDAIEARVAAFAPGRMCMVGIQPAAPALQRMDVFVMASRQEPFALASLEAMAAGLPVIATSVGGFPEQIEHLKSGILVPPEDPHAIADWIGRLRDDPALRERLGAAARERVLAHFTLERQCAEIDSAYRKAVALRGHRSCGA